MSDKKFESVLLEANVRLNFLQFIVKVGIASDHEHSDFWWISMLRRSS